MPQIIEVPNYGQVEFPDGMSDDEITKAIQSNMQPQKQSLPTLSHTDKVVKGLKDPVDAGAQLLTRMLPDSVVNAGNQLNNFIADKTGLLPKLGAGGVDELIKQGEQEYQGKRLAQGESGFDGYRAIGNIASPANLALASKLPAATSLTRTIAGGAGLSAATVPVLEGDFWTEKAKQAAVGGAFAPVGNALARIASPKASLNPQVQALKKEGVNPTIGQTLGGIPNKIEEKMTSLPIMGDMISRARGQVNKEFERAAFNRALAPIGKELPKNLRGNDAVVFAENALKDKYDDVLTKIGAITPDDAFNQKLSSLKGMVDDLVMPQAEKSKFANALNNVKQSIDDNGVITSSAYKKLESDLGTKARKLEGSQNIYEFDLAPAVKQLQAELRDMLQRQAGDFADELKKANTGWANFKRVQNAASKLGAESGEFTPSQFQNAVRALDKSKDKSAFARGNALGQDLGSAGKTVLGNKVPNSGTAERLLYGTGALASGAVNPAIPASLLAGGALYTKPVQNLLSSSVSSRPELAVPLAEFLRQNGKYVAPAATAGLLNSQ